MHALKNGGRKFSLWRRPSNVKMVNIKKKKKCKNKKLSTELKKKKDKAKLNT